MHSVFIVGGSGKVARSLAQQLAERGHQPHSLYRHAEQAEGLEALGAIPVAGNLLDLDTEALAAEDAAPLGDAEPGVER